MLFDTVSYSKGRTIAMRVLRSPKRNTLEFLFRYFLANAVLSTQGSCSRSSAVNVMIRSSFDCCAVTIASMRSADWWPLCLTKKIITAVRIWVALVVAI